MTLIPTNTGIHKPLPYERSITSKRRMFEGRGMGTVTLSYDDTCGNGHNSFSITVDGNYFGGCMHDEVAEVFPEYAHLIKWHLFDTDGPMHYIANTLYHAEDKRINARAKVSVAEMELKHYISGHENIPCKDCPEYGETIKKLGWAIDWAQKTLDKADGPNLEHARSTGCAPEATIEQLQDKGWLECRLPGLIEEFKEAMEKVFGTGF